MSAPEDIDLAIEAIAAEFEGGFDEGVSWLSDLDYYIEAVGEGPGSHYALHDGYSRELLWSPSTLDEAAETVYTLRRNRGIVSAL